MVDTVYTIDTVVVFARDTILQLPSTVEIARDAQQFYSESFSHLLAVIAIFGIGVPVIAWLIQNSKYKDQNKSLQKQQQDIEKQRNDIDDQSKEIKKQSEGITKLEDRLLINIKEAIDSMDRRVSEVESGLNEKFVSIRQQAQRDAGNIWVVNGLNADLDDTKFIHFAFGLRLYMDAKHHRGFNRAIEHLAKLDYSKVEADTVNMLWSMRDEIGKFSVSLSPDFIESQKVWEDLKVKWEEVMSAYAKKPGVDAETLSG